MSGVRLLEKRYGAVAFFKESDPITPDNPLTHSRMISASESLQRLRDGNARFAANVRGLESFLTQSTLAIREDRHEHTKLVQDV